MHKRKIALGLLHGFLTGLVAFGSPSLSALLLGDPISLYDHLIQGALILLIYYCYGLFVLLPFNRYLRR
jgi:hypothetical protein